MNVFTKTIMEKYQAKVNEMLLQYTGKLACTLTDPEEIIAIGVMSGGEIDYNYDVTTGLMKVSPKGICGAIWTGTAFQFSQNPWIKG